jgi:hypothetical protein
VWIEKYQEAGGRRNRVALVANGDTVGLLQTAGEDDYGSLFTGGIRYLSVGDYIGLKALYPSKLWMAKAHTFFGAYKI